MSQQRDATIDPRLTGTPSLGLDSATLRIIKVDATGQVYIANPGSAAASTSANLEVTGSASALNADVIASTDVNAYRWVTLHLTNTSTSTITFQGSNDNSNFVGVFLARADGGVAVTASGFVGAINSVFHGPLGFRYFRARLTSYSSGTVTGTAEFSGLPSAMPVINVEGNISSGSSDLGGPVKIGGVQRTTPPTLADAQRGDAQLDTRANLKVALIGRDTDTAIGTNTAPLVTAFQRPTFSDLTEVTINAAASGDNTIVANTPSQTTRVFKLFLVCDAAVDITIKRSATALTGAMKMAAGGAIVLDFDGEPWFTTGVNESFTLTLSAAVGIRGRCYYIQN